MAKEITLTGSLSIFKAAIMNSVVGRTVNGLQINMTGLVIVQNSVIVSTTGLLLDMGQVVTCHWAFFQNLDPTNFLTIATGIAGTPFLRLLPGEPAFVPLDTACAPFAKANTLPVQLDYLIASL